MDDVSKDDTIFILGEGVRFEPKKRCLINEFGTVINLPENSYRFLLLLLEGETNKQNIINQVWHEQRGSVSDSSYYGQIYMLRKSFDQIGLSSDSIKTIPRKGVKYMGILLREKTPASDLTTESTINKMPPVISEDLIEEPVSSPGNVECATNTDSAGSGGAGREWYHSRSWNVFISILALLAVCWISTLIVILIFFFTK